MTGNSCVKGKAESTEEIAQIAVSRQISQKCAVAVIVFYFLVILEPEHPWNNGPDTVTFLIDALLLDVPIWKCQKSIRVQGRMP